MFDQINVSLLFIQDVNVCFSMIWFLYGVEDIYYCYNLCFENNWMLSIYFVDDLVMFINLVWLWLFNLGGFWVMNVEMWLYFVVVGLMNDIVFFREVLMMDMVLIVGLVYQLCYYVFVLFGVDWDIIENNIQVMIVYVMVMLMEDL